MKKNYLLLAAFASALTFAACSNDELGEITNGPVVNEVVEGATFEIDLSSPANGTTKATRPMGSSSADNMVDCIQLVAYYWDADATGGPAWKQCTLVNTAPSDETTYTEGQLAFYFVSGDADVDMTENTWMQYGQIYYKADQPTEGVPGTDVHISKRAKIEVKGLVKDTKYQFVAYGYNRTSGDYPYTNGPQAVTTTGFENGIFTANVAATTLQNAYKLEEIFAATDVAETIEIGEENNKQTVFSVTPSLTLKRQVAGILAYFEYIPARMNRMDRPSDEIYKVEELRVVASHKSKDFYFPAALLENPDFNGIAADEDGEEILMKFEFSKIATNYGETNLNAQSFYTFNGTDGGTEADKKYPYATDYNAPADLALKSGTIFGARYILPYDKHYSDETTLKLQFWGTNTNNTQPVLLEERDVTTNVTGVDKNAYDIRCNNFYSIGQKLKTDDTDGPDDEDDTDDDDKPIDLRSGNITLRINDAWAVLHNMGVDNIE